MRGHLESLSEVSLPRSACERLDRPLERRLLTPEAPLSLAEALPLGIRETVSSKSAPSSSESARLAGPLDRDESAVRREGVKRDQPKSALSSH